MTYDENSEEAKTGAYWEVRIEEFLKEVCTKVNKIVCYNDSGKRVAQTFLYGGGYHSKPDFEVSLSNNGNIDLYVEAKSSSFAWIDRKMFSVSEEIVLCAKMSRRQFNDYVLFQKVMNTKVKVIFVIEDMRSWYTETIDWLNKHKQQAISSKGYEYFIWKLDDLKKIKTNITSRPGSQEECYDNIPDMSDADGFSFG